MKIKRQPVVYGPDKVRSAQWRPLSVGDGDQWHIRKPTIERHVIGEILSAVKRRHSPHRFRSKQRKVQVIDMEVQDIELGDALPHLVKHQHMMRNWVTDIPDRGATHGKCTERVRPR